MMEIQQLMRKLKQYPSNWFVYPTSAPAQDTETKDGLVIRTIEGEEKDFIELGDTTRVIIDG